MRYGKMTMLAAGAALALSGCARQVVGTTTALPGAAAPALDENAPGTVGAPTAKGAVEAFLAAVNKQDLQVMSGLWGNSNGLARDQLKRDELEKRLIIIQCLLQHDRFRYLEDTPRLSTGSRQSFQVELTRGPNRAPAAFTTVPVRTGRWLVEDVDVTKLREFCR